MNEFEKILDAFEYPKPPQDIWQKPFDHDPRHYARLCDVSQKPTCIDICDYILDYTYMEVQPDLLFFLLPRISKTLGETLLNDTEGYAGAEEGFFEAIKKRPLCPEYITQVQFEAMAHYFASVLLLKMGRENELYHVGSGSSPYRWFSYFNDFTMAFPYLDYVWERWWSLPNEPLTICMVQYASCLLYDIRENPVFAPRTPEKGGGPPEGFWHKQGLIYDPIPHPKNLLFLKSVLSVEYVHQKLIEASEKVSDPENSRIIKQILNEFSFQSIVLEERIKKISDNVEYGK